MYSRSVVLIFLISAVCGQHYTRVYYKNEPFNNFPLSRSRKYKVFEGEEDITQDSAGHRLRFAYNPQIIRSRSHPMAPYDDFKGLRQSRQSYPIFASDRREIPRYGFRPPREEEALPINSIKRHEFVINRPAFRYKLLPEEERYVNQPLHYTRRPKKIYYIDDPYQNLRENNILKDERPLRNILRRDQNFERRSYSPIFQNREIIQKYPLMVYSPKYSYESDPKNPIPSSSHLPLYVRDIYSPGYKYGGVSGSINGIGGSLEKSYVDNDNKKLLEEQYHKEDGKKKDEYIEDEEKLKKDEEVLKHKSSDGGHYSDEKLQKKNVEDQEKYDGGKTYKQEGQNENEKKNKSSHKKGHVIRSFKNSHHKEESGNNEEYYDEQHDVGDSFKLDASAGHFGENKAEAFKGDHGQKEYVASEKLDKGNHESAEITEKIKEVKNENKESKEESNLKHYGNSNFKDEQSLLGHQESKNYFEGHPYHVPIHRHM
ncbi:hypothetical protein Trydic_g5968 [Trypoxylus dichotomus]